MRETTDRALLDTFAASRSEEAFRVLVERHLDHVHSVARRVTHNEDLAKDVSQQVFIKLATQYQKIPSKLSLAVWLHVNTRSLAIDLVRSEEARRRREQSAQQLAVMNAPEPDLANWSTLEPVIDEVIESLPHVDREIVIMRFYQKRSHGDIGTKLGIAPDAARMRLNRALEKLRNHLSKRGITTTVAALALSLPANAVSPAPAALASTISSSAVAASAASTATVTSTAKSLITVAKSHLVMITTVVVATPIIGLQQIQHQQLKGETASLRSSLQAEPASASNLETTTAANPHHLPHLIAQQDPMSRIRALSEYVSKLTPNQISSALEDLRRGASGWDSEAGFVAHMMLTRWGQEDADRAFASLEEIDLKQRSGDATSILASLTTQDRERALAWLNDPNNSLLHLGYNGHYLAGTIAKEWVRQDPDAALAWAKSLPDNQRAGAYSGVLGSLATKDPESASTLAMELEPGGDRREIVGEIAHYWARQSPQSALTWAEDLDGTEQRQAISNALSGWAQTAPSEAAAYLDQLPEHQQAATHVVAVTSTWARQSPVDAAEWVDDLSESQGKADAMGHLIWNWTTTDPQAASSWLAEQPSGTGRDVGIANLTNATFDSDPESALTWATTIADGTMRERTVQEHLRAWNKRDPNAAQTWASESGIQLSRE